MEASKNIVYIFYKRGEAERLTELNSLAVALGNQVLLGFANMNLQTIFRFKVAVTFVTLESFCCHKFCFVPTVLYPLQKIYLRQRQKFLVKKLSPPPSISLKSMGSSSSSMSHLPCMHSA